MDGAYNSVSRESDFFDDRSSLFTMTLPPAPAPPTPKMTTVGEDAVDVCERRTPRQSEAGVMRHAINLTIEQLFEQCGRDNAEVQRAVARFMQEKRRSESILPEVMKERSTADTSYFRAATLSNDARASLRLRDLKEPADDDESKAGKNAGKSEKALKKANQTGLKKQIKGLFASRQCIDKGDNALPANGYDKPVLFVHLMEAENIPDVPDRKSGKINSYAQMYVVSSSDSMFGAKEADFVSTEMAYNNSNPIWNFGHAFKYADIESDILVVDIYDHHKAKDDFLLARSVIPLKEIMIQNQDIGSDLGLLGLCQWFPLFAPYSLFPGKQAERVSGSIYLRMAIPMTKEALKFTATRMIRFSKLPVPQKVMSSRIKIFTTTWNVGNAIPPDDLSSWIPVGIYDLYAIGVQECQYDARPGYDKCREDWRCVVVRHLGPGYTLVESKGLWEIRLSIFIRNDMAINVSNVKFFKQGTGIAGVGGNKGGVTIGLSYMQTPISFTSAHLAAHQDKSKHRNEDIQQIFKNTSITKRHNSTLALAAPSLYQSSYYSFFMGDLNYRLDFGEQAQSQDRKPTHEDFKSLCDLIEEGPTARRVLMDLDQLNINKKAGEIFAEFKEGDPAKFKPTFKVERNIPKVQYVSIRSPAYCDRILWRTLDGQPEPMQISYESCEELSTSDHKPVTAVFNMPIQTLHPGIDPSCSDCCWVTFSDIQLEGFQITTQITHLKSKVKHRTYGGELHVSVMGSFIPQGWQTKPRKSPWTWTETSGDIRCAYNNRHRLMQTYVFIDIAQESNAVGHVCFPLFDLQYKPFNVIDTHYIRDFNEDIIWAGKKFGKITGEVALKWAERNDDEVVFPLDTSSSSSSLASV